MRIAFTTFGCKINQYETEEMQRSVAAAGNKVVPFDADADVYVINTCSVTAKSDSQCRQAIRSAIRRHEGAEVVVTGCYAETRSQDILNIRGVARILANKDKQDIVRHITNSTGEHSPHASGRIEAMPGRTRNFLKIQDGCSSRCSYCIVPLARGDSRSRGRDDVVREFEAAVGSGVPEVVLSGIHIGKYGADLDSRMSLTDLVRQLLDLRKSTRIRLSSIEPGEVTPELIEMIGHGLCRHLHIPLQSGDDNILSSMNRTYSTAQYQRLIETIAKRIPDIAIGTDVMVGFPGEGELQFTNTLKLLNDLPFTHLHVFSYSPRQGTPAASMPSPVPDLVKRKRNEQIRSLGLKKNMEFRRSFINRSLDAVVERGASGTSFVGLTDNYIRTSLAGADVTMEGRLVPIVISNIENSVTNAVISSKLL